MKLINLGFITIVTIFLLTGCTKDKSMYPSIMENAGATVYYEDENAPTKLDVAIVTFAVKEQKSENIAIMQEMITKIKSENPSVRLICFAETVLAHYYHPNNPEYIQNNAETKSGATSTVFSDIAKRNDIYISYGYAEKDGEKYYNSLLVIDPQGDIIANHHKAKLFSYEADEIGFTEGNKATICYIDGIKTGLSICYGANDETLAKEYIEAECKLIIYPIGDENYEMFQGAGRHFNAWVLTANWAGEQKAADFNVVFNGYQEISAPTGEKRVFTADIKDKHYDRAIIGIW